MSQGFYFQSQENRLLGFYHPARNREEGFVLCYPSPQEMVRAQPSQVQLARKLQALGYPVLRFDYSGTGDSEGRIGPLTNWQQDTLSAVYEFKKKSGVSKVSLVGTRLGAAVAILASQEQGFKRLLLWDPVVDGDAFRNSLEQAHSRMLNRVPFEAPYASNQKEAQQCCGFEWPHAFTSSLGLIQPSALSTFSRTIQVAVSQTSPALAALAATWESEGKRVNIVETQEDMKWGNDRYMILLAFPAASLRVLSTLAEEG